MLSTQVSTVGLRKSSQVDTLPKAKSKTRSKQNKDMHRCSSVYSERGVPLPVLTSGGDKAIFTLVRCTTDELLFSYCDNRAPPRRHCQRPQLVKGKSPQGLRVKGYCTDRETFTLLRCITDELFLSCCDCVAAHFKHAATRQPRRKPSLKPFPTPPRSYGRRHRSWHYEPQAQTNC